MLKVTVELHPYGSSVHKRILTQFEIVNTGKTSNPDTYIVRENKASQPLFEFHHKREDGLNHCCETAFSLLNTHGLDKIGEM